MDSLIQYSPKKPDLIIGDLDSLSSKSKDTFLNQTLKIEDQNKNDLTKAVEFAISKKAEKIILLGTSGGREDHAIANFSLYFEYAKKCANKIDLKIYTDHGKISVVKSGQKIKSFIGEKISFFTENSTVVLNCIDLKWPLVNKSFDSFWQGSLNESLSDELVVEFKNGVCLVFQNYTNKI